MLHCLCPPMKGKPSKVPSDVDLFIYGLDSAGATRKVTSMLEWVEERARQTGHAPRVFRSQHALTICQRGKANIQVILRLYRSPTEVLAGFDLDCCCVAYDGRRVLALPRALSAIRTSVNLADPSRRSLSYEARLHKYAGRGFAVGVPGLQHHRAVQFAWRWSKSALKEKLVGLAQLVAKDARGALWDRRASEFPSTQDDRTEHGGEQALMAENDRELDVGGVHRGDEDRDYDRYLAGLLDNRQADDPPPHEPLKEQPLADGSTLLTGTLAQTLDANNSHGPLKFVEHDPGRQVLSGSFHPLPAHTWGQGLLATPLLDWYRDRHAHQEDPPPTTRLFGRPSVRDLLQAALSLPWPPPAAALPHDNSRRRCVWRFGLRQVGWLPTPLMSDEAWSAVESAALMLYVAHITSLPWQLIVDDSSRGGVLGSISEVLFAVIDAQHCSSSDRDSNRGRAADEPHEQQQHEQQHAQQQHRQQQQQQGDGGVTWSDAALQRAVAVLARAIKLVAWVETFHQQHRDPHSAHRKRDPQPDSCCFRYGFAGLQEMLRFVALHIVILPRQDGLQTQRKTI